VAQVEVLRGPQGTLYGRNTTAGVVNVQSARPKAKWEGSFDAKVGNLNSQNYTGMINAPIGDSLGIRLAANYDRQDSNVLKRPTTPIRSTPIARSSRRACRLVAISAA
jgi:iron complex outermembrane receptor protein